MSSVAIRPTETEVPAPCTMRENTSHPCLVNPSGWPATGAPLLFASWHPAFGGTEVMSPGKSATNRMSAISATDSQNVGRRRRSSQASLKSVPPCAGAVGRAASISASS